MLGTMAAKAVARELLRHPNGTRWSREISNAIQTNEGTTIRRGSVSRILAQMADEGWLSSQRELREDCRTRLTRLYYQITTLGQSRLQEFVGIEQDASKPLIAVGQ